MGIGKADGTASTWVVALKLAALIWKSTRPVYLGCGLRRRGFR